MHIPSESHVHITPIAQILSFHHSGNRKQKKLFPTKQKASNLPFRKGKKQTNNTWESVLKWHKLKDPGKQYCWFHRHFSNSQQPPVMTKLLVSKKFAVTVHEWTFKSRNNRKHEIKTLTSATCLAAVKQLCTGAFSGVSWLQLQRDLPYSSSPTTSQWSNNLSRLNTIVF